MEKCKQSNRKNREKKQKKKTTPGLEDCVASYFPIGNNAWVNNV